MFDFILMKKDMLVFLLLIQQIHLMSAQFLCGGTHGEWPDPATPTLWKWAKGNSNSNAQLTG
jgi:hypothetical protein